MSIKITLIIAHLESQIMFIFLIYSLSLSLPKRRSLVTWSLESTESHSLELIVEVREGPCVAPGRGPRPRDLVHDVCGGGGVGRGGVVEPAEVVGHHAAVGAQLHWGQHFAGGGYNMLDTLLKYSVENLKLKLKSAL